MARYQEFRVNVEGLENFAVFLHVWNRNRQDKRPPAADSCRVNKAI